VSGHFAQEEFFRLPNEASVKANTTQNNFRRKHKANFYFSLSDVDEFIFLNKQQAKEREKRQAKISLMKTNCES
jgi:hypothetical protein